MKKILIYNNNEFQLGGTEKYALFLAKALQERNDVTFAYYGTIHSDKIKEKYGIELKKTKVIKIGNPSTFLKRKLRDYSNKTSSEIISKMSKNFDLLIVNSYKAIHQVNPKAKKNILITHAPHRPNLKMPLKKILKQMFNDPYEIIAHYLFPPLKSFYADRYDEVICNSQFTAKLVKQRWGMEADILYPPVNIHRSPTKKKNLIISLCRLHNQKMGLEMVRCFKRAMKHIGNYQYKLMVYGDEDPERKRYLRKIEKELKNSERIQLIISPSNKEIEKSLSESIIFWNLAGMGAEVIGDRLQPESFGMVNVEAMAHGCIPIIYNCGGHKEIVENGKSGFLVNNENELIEKTMIIIKDQNKIEKMSKQAVLRVQNFSLEHFKNRIKIINN